MESSKDCINDDVNSWEYRGEGSASLVIANGKIHKVLKLQKCLVDTKSCKISDATDDDTKQQLKFAESILKPLLGSYICVPEVVAVTPTFLQSINNKVKESRPSARLHKIVDVNSKFAQSLPDLCFLHPFHGELDAPVYCVEIKPKKGFLPTSPWILAEEEVKKEVCYFCQLQHLKIQEGTWSEISKYCPIDLFSGNPMRMKYALNQLLRNPQNNLRIFKNGELLYGAQGKSKPSADDHIRLQQDLDTLFGASIERDNIVEEDPLKSHAVQSFLEVVLKALLHSKEERSPLHAKPSLPSQTCKASGFEKSSLSDSNTGNQRVCKLPDDSVLDTILQVQRLDDLDIEGVYAMYQKHQNMTSSTTVEASSDEGKQLDWPYDEKRFLQKVLSSETPVITQDMDNVTIDDAVHKIRMFLLAGTAKDCSVLLAIQPSGAADRSRKYPYTCHHDNKTYLYSSHIIDLDTKPSSRIPKYYQLNKKLVKIYNSF